MTYRAIPLILVFALSACGDSAVFQSRNAGAATVTVAPAGDTTRPVGRPDLGAAALTAVAPTASGPLGTTVASLGDPASPGLWLETSLVSIETSGRVITEGGRSADVTLRPSGGAAGAGSRISLAAMQALGLNLTSLPTLSVIAGG
jgi:hypothetical protein